MPIYEYQCTKCHHQLEAFQSLSEAPLTDCPECRQPSLTKLISAAGFQLKGSGWYLTDYSAKGKRPSSGNDASTSSSDTKASETSGSGSAGSSTSTTTAATGASSS